MLYVKEYKETGLDISSEPCDAEYLPLRAGDIITHVNGIANSSAQMLDALKAVKLEFTLQRVSEKVVVGQPVKESESEAVANTSAGQVQGQAEEKTGADQPSQTVAATNEETKPAEQPAEQTEKEKSEIQNAEPTSDQVEKGPEVNEVEPPADQTETQDEPPADQTETQNEPPADQSETQEEGKKTEQDEPAPTEIEQSESYGCNWLCMK
jgi:hypothetical protein